MKKVCHAELASLNEVILTHLEQRIPQIAEVAKHLILAGGKRLRPLLALACYRALDCTPNNETSFKMVELAASIEFIHNATLLHDDVVDDSPTRRGRPTANALWGNKPSILVGDFLFAKAFELMLGANEKRVLPILAKVCQTITEGEVFQLAYLKTFDLDDTILLRIIGSKTASLFAASCEIGAALLGESEETQKGLHHFGYNLGVTFQIIDDLLDYIGDTVSLGKKVGDDLREGKVTLPLHIAYQKSHDGDKRLLEDIIKRSGSNTSDFDTVISILHKSGAVEESYTRAWHYANEAVKGLSPLKNSSIKNILENLGASFIVRDN
ncbi:MAG: polyprenyl synthetase family protein [Alphaproteobacteria bacterium]|nr:polyprenyl synthetase family protein [Alphaproteobacteria bacterium]